MVRYQTFLAVKKMSEETETIIIIPRVNNKREDIINSDNTIMKHNKNILVTFSKLTSLPH